MGLQDRALIVQSMRAGICHESRRALTELQEKVVEQPHVRHVAALAELEMRRTFLRHPRIWGSNEGAEGTWPLRSGLDKACLSIAAFRVAMCLVRILPPQSLPCHKKYSCGHHISGAAIDALA